MRLERLCGALVAVILVSGCGFYGRRAEWKEVLPPAQPPALLSDGTSGSPETDACPYLVGNGDGLEVKVAGHEEFCGQIAVDQRGRMRLPGGEDVVDVAGLTLSEVEGRVAARLAPYLVGEPRVRVSLLESRSKYYYVLGGVWAPGVYGMRGEVVRLRDALARAGFFREYRADQRRIGIITPDPVKPAYVIADGHKVLMGVDEQNIPIKPGDIIFVQDRLIYDIDGFLYNLFRETENVSTTNRAVEFWEDAIDGEIGDFTYPRSSVTVIY